MSAPIEARRMSGEHIGTVVELSNGAAGRVVAVEHTAALRSVRVALYVGQHYRRWHILAPTDVVTLTGTTPSEEGS